MKTGGGDLNLSGSGGYGGGTMVEVGMLTVTTIGAIPDTALTVAAGGTFVFDPQASANGDSLAASPDGAVAPAGGVSPVPEPGTEALFGAAGIVAAVAAWRRRQGRQG